MAVFSGLFNSSIDFTEKEGTLIQAKGTLAADLEFFKDHFPGFPVLPGVMTLELMKQVIEKHECSASQNEEALYRIEAVHSVKFASVVLPGSEWEATIEITPQQDGTQRCKGKMISAGKTAAVADWTISPLNSK